MRTEKEIEALDKLKPKSNLGIRHLQTILLFVAMVMNYSMRTNISLVIVDMTDQTKENAFDWSMQKQSVILSSFFWGCVVLQVPGGMLATKFGGAILITISVSVNAIVSLVTPLAAHYGGWQALCACRVIQGLCQGFMTPTIHHLIGKWIPLEERSSIGAIIYAGAQLGIALQLIASGFIAEYWGWPAVFYVNGALGTIWTVLYIFLGADSPRSSKMISDQERLYVETSLGQVGVPKKFKTPWCAIFTSLPFLSLIVAHCSHNWGFGTLITEMPSYFKKVLNVDIKSNGVMSSLPYLCTFVTSFPFGFICDHILNKQYLSVTATRKLFNSIGFYGPAIALLGLTYMPVGSKIAAASVLCLLNGLNTGRLTGFLLVHIDMAPNFAGVLMGITNFFANFATLFAPLAAGALLKDETNPKEWHKIFYVSSAVYFIGNTLFLIFGTCEMQSWNNAEPKDQNDTSNEIKEKKVKV